MASPGALSPELSRISVDHPSIATTATSHSSNLGSPSNISPATSGALSPVGLNRTTAESVSRTFQDAIKQKKLLLTQSAFIRADGVVSSIKYQRFQEHVQQVKRVPPLEKDEKKSTAGKQKSVFTEMGEKEYFKLFPIKADVNKDGSLKVLPLCNVHVARSAVSEYEQDITAYEMGDGIAVFCLSKKKIVVHHLSSGTTSLKAVCDQFAKFSRAKRAFYEIYLAGGDGSPESVQLLHNIHSAILIFFGNKGLVKEKFIHATQGTEKPYISVACTRNKKFFFCRHD